MTTDRPQPDGEGEAGADPRDGADASEALAGHSLLQRALNIETIEGNSVTGGTVSIGRDLVFGQTSTPIPIIDITASAEAFADSFVEPPGFDQLSRTLAAERVVVLTGHGNGKRTAAIEALRRASQAPILAIQSDADVSSLIDEIERRCKQQSRAGLLITGASIETVVGFTGFARDRLGVVLRDGALVITSEFPVDRRPGLPVVECGAPNPIELADSMAARHGLGSEPMRAARLVIGLLRSAGGETLYGHSVEPSVVRATVDAVATGELDPEAIAATVIWNPEKLDAWLDKQHIAVDLARLAGGVALAGIPTDEAEDEIGRLAQHLDPGAAERQENQKAFGSRHQAWPAGFIGTRRELVGSHFGSHLLEVLYVCPPHDRARLLSHLWAQLASDFRNPFADWVRALGESPKPMLRAAGATTAGILFIRDPVTAESELLRPWALSPHPSVRRSAAIALGMPGILGIDPSAARTLVNHWSKNRNQALRHTAVIAYGGPLGAWDANTPAPVHLWRLGEDDEDLLVETDRALANLTVAGHQAARARALTFELLNVLVAERSERSRVFRLLPLIVARLTAPFDVARDSLTALITDELESLAKLAALLTSALTAPGGYESASDCMALVLEGIADGHVEFEVVFALIRAMQLAADAEDQRDRFASALNRSIRGHQRHSKHLSDAADLLLDRLYTGG